jgi:hypothetical protein
MGRAAGFRFSGRHGPLFSRLGERIERRIGFPIMLGCGGV